MQLERKLTRLVTYWASAGESHSGQKGWAEPIEIRARWEDTEEQRQVGTDSVYVSKARVFTDTHVLKEGALWKGRLSEADDPENPFGNDGAIEIMEVLDVPNRLDTQHLYTAYG